MKRRVIKQGNNTLTITLPKEWTKKFGVKAGDELEVEEKKQQLIINTNKNIQLGKISIHIPKNSSFPRRLIYIPYIKGYDEIEISFEDEDTLNLIDAHAKMMLGFEMVQQGRNYCVLKNVAQGIESEFMTIFNRLALISISMGKDIYSLLLEDNIEKLTPVTQIEGLANKFCLFCRRMLNCQRYEGDKNNNSLYRLTSSFEEITDDYRDICNTLLASKIKLKKETLNLLKNVNEFGELSYKLISHFEVEKIKELKKKESAVLKEATDLIKQVKGEEAAVVCSLIHIIQTNHNISEEVF